MALLPDVLPAGVIELRRWRTTYLEEVMAAVAASFTELQRWMPWAQTMPSAVEQRAVLEAAELAFDADREWRYLLFERASGNLVGAAGLHRRIGPGGLEIGYWVRSDRIGRGYATAAARALSVAAFTHVPDVQRVEIRMDIANLASAAIPPKLEFRLDHEEDREIQATGQTGRGLVWVLDRGAADGRKPVRAGSRQPPRD